MSKDKRVAIITGSSSGIGASTARELAGRGWNVVINYTKSAEAAQKVVAQCVAKGVTIAALERLHRYLRVEGGDGLNIDYSRLQKAALHKRDPLD